MINQISNDGFYFNNTPFILLAERAVWLPKEEALLIADLHIDKASFFRKNGIGLPSYYAALDFNRLEKLLIKYIPKTVYIIGDLTHEFAGIEWEMFQTLTLKHNKTSFILIEGNHDRLSSTAYQNAGIKTAKTGSIGELMLLHEPLETISQFHVGGHLHPGYQLKGKGRQSLKTWCFALYKNRLVLPAFSTLTGLWLCNISKPAHIWLPITKEIMHHIAPKSK